MSTYTAPNNKWTNKHKTLSPREIEACLHVANGATNKAGARDMGISPSTFTKALQRAMYKLGTYTRAETVAEAIRQQIISSILLMICVHSLISATDPALRNTSRIRTANVYRRI